MTGDYMMLALDNTGRRELLGIVRKKAIIGLHCWQLVAIDSSALLAAKIE